MISDQIADFLKQAGVRFEFIRHPRAYTAQMTAEAAHIPGRMMAKTVVVRIGDSWAMLVLPADEKVDMGMVRDIFGTDRCYLAGEDDLLDLFGDCELGGMPPFGNLYGMEVYVAEDLAKDERIAFNAGDHSKLVSMAYADYDRVVHPHVMRFTIE